MKYSEHEQAFFPLNYNQMLCCHSDTQSAPWTLCDPMDYSLPGFPALHCLLKFARTRVHWVGDAIESSYPLLNPSLLPSMFSSIRLFSVELALRIRWPKYWSFSFSPSNEYSELISFRIDWFDLLAVQGPSRVFFSTTVQKHQLFSTHPSLSLVP